MIVDISIDAELDVEHGYWFYEGQSRGLGEYFRDCILADIESLAYYGGVHEFAYGYRRSLSKRFPFAIYYDLVDENVTVVAVIDARRDPSWTRKRLS